MSDAHETNASTAWKGFATASVALLLAFSAAAALTKQDVYGTYHWLGDATTAQNDASKFDPQKITVYQNGTSSPTNVISAVLDPGLKVGSWWLWTKGSQVANFEFLATGGNSLLWTKNDAYGEKVVLGTRLDYISYHLAYEGGSTTHYIYTNDLVIASCTTARTGYTFAGAWTNRAGTAFAVGSAATGASFSIANHDDEAVVTLYPKWTTHAYRIRFNVNAEDYAGPAMDDLRLSYDESANLPANAFVREGYSFAGWAESSTGEVKYGDKAAVRNLTSVDGAVVDLYAVWTKLFTVKWKDASQFGSTVLKTETVAKGEDAEPPDDPEHAGYAFLGWSQDGKGITANKTILATYEANHYYVWFDANDGSASPRRTSQLFTYDVPAALKPNDNERTGYVFLGWSTNRTDATPVYQDGASVMNLRTEGSIDLYAVWKANHYTVRYDPDNGSGSMDDQAFVFDQPQALSSNLFVNGEFAFLGWDGSEGGRYADGQVVSNLSAEVDGVVILTARWTGRIVFDGNGATAGTMSPQIITDTENEQNLTSNAYVKTGYTFVGWATNAADAAALKICRTDGARVEGLAQPGASLTLYAAWKAITYSVAFSAGEGVEIKALAVTNVTYDQAFRLPAVTNGNYQASDPELYAFAGWTNRLQGVRHGDQAVVSNLCTVANATNTLVALWSKEAGDWSRHMHCETLRWSVDNVGFSTSWQKQTGPDLGGAEAAYTCVFQDGGGSLSDRDWLSATVRTNGTLSLKCRWRTEPQGNVPRLCIGFTTSEERASFHTSGTRGDCNVTATDWTNLEIRVQIQTDKDDAVIHLTAMSMADDILEIDQVVWTPEGGGADEPQPGVDNPTVTGFSIENGQIVIRSTGDARFGYQVLSTLSLSPPNWQPESDSYQAGQGEGQAFTLPISSSEPQKFFKIEVLKKK